MRFPIVFSVWALLAMTSISYGAKFSQNRDLPPLKLSASELDAILNKTHSLVDAANGPAIAESSGRESVKLGVDGYDFDLPRFQLEGNLAFPKDIFSFSYAYELSDQPISSVAIDLGDYARRISVSGESADKVVELSNLIEKDFRLHSIAIGGEKFRHAAGVILSMTFLIAFMVGSVSFWKTRSYWDLGMSMCGALGFLLVVQVPWNRFLPGFVLYQRRSPFFVVRHSPELSVVAIVVALAGITLTYFLARRRSNSR